MLEAQMNNPELQRAECSQNVKYLQEQLQQVEIKLNCSYNGSILHTDIEELKNRIAAEKCLLSLYGGNTKTKLNPTEKIESCRSSAQDVRDHEGYDGDTEDATSDTSGEYKERDLQISQCRQDIEKFENEAADLQAFDWAPKNKTELEVVKSAINGERQFLNQLLTTE